MPKALYTKMVALCVVAALALPTIAYSCSDTRYPLSDVIIAPNTWWLNSAAKFQYDGHEAMRPAPWRMCAKLVAPNSSPELVYAQRCVLPGLKAETLSSMNGNATWPNCNTTMWALWQNANTTTQVNMMRAVRH